MKDHVVLNVLGDKYVVYSRFNGSIKYIVDINSCTCPALTSMMLPCTHWLKLRSIFHESLYDGNVCAKRWTQNYLVQCHRVFKKALHIHDNEPVALDINTSSSNSSQNLNPARPAPPNIAGTTTSSSLARDDTYATHGHAHSPLPDCPDYSKVKFKPASKARGRPKQHLSVIGLPRKFPGKAQSVPLAHFSINLNILPRRSATQKGDGSAFSANQILNHDPQEPVTASDFPDVPTAASTRCPTINENICTTVSSELPAKRNRKIRRFSDIDYDFVNQPSTTCSTILRESVQQQPDSLIRPFHDKSLSSKFKLIGEWIITDGLLCVDDNTKPVQLADIHFKQVFDYNIYNEDFDINIVKQHLDQEVYDCFYDIYTTNKPRIKDSCQICLSPEDFDDCVRCDSCFSWLHISCASLSAVPTEEDLFYCDKCRMDCIQRQPDDCWSFVILSLISRSHILARETYVLAFKNPSL
ncbi:hypothetical protein QAD02_021928 [Eretmocerus hayati]|uniref:Uncharacterized protein n=1 Tax=Eretmocerus hayati TaxID=131215 RepID=A0ACC2PU37_9HYME|nr:hypothetical protein QAD02_021928 [Eretmocerus hayati]